MNKKIWIGLASVFLILVLVLGFQMLNKESKSPLKEEQNGDETSEFMPTEEEVEQAATNINKDNVTSSETTESILGTSEELENSEVGETPIESENSADIPNELTKQTEIQVIPEIKETEDTAKYITLSVSAKTLLDKKDLMNQEKVELVPKDGWIFPAQKVEFYEGESAFNVLLREMKKNKIHMEYVMTPIYNSNYIEGIGNLYELDCGELSGWMYAVNDLAPNLGTTNYILNDGDVVKLLYTCDLGRDLGFDFNE